MDYVMNGRTAGAQGHYHPRMAPHGNYPCLGDDAWVSIAVETEQEWQSLCEVMGDPAWVQDERFHDASNRIKNRLELDDFIGLWTRRYSPQEICSILQSADVACFPVQDILELYGDPHEQHQRLSTLVEVPDRTPADIIYGIPWRLHDTPGSIRTPQAELGEHNSYVFHELLGLSSMNVIGNSTRT